MQSAQLFSGGLQIAGKQSSNVIQKPVKSYLTFYHVGLGIRCFGKKIRQRKQVKHYFL